MDLVQKITLGIVVFIVRILSHYFGYVDVDLTIVSGSCDHFPSILQCQWNIQYSHEPSLLLYNCSLHEVSCKIEIEHCANEGPRIDLVEFQHLMMKL